MTPLQFYRVQAAGQKAATDAAVPLEAIGIRDDGGMTADTSKGTV